LPVTRKLFPRLAGIIGAIETAARLRLDERVDAVRIGGRDGEVRLPTSSVGNPVVILEKCSPPSVLL
jgi:hypothetical protein